MKKLLLNVKMLPFLTTIVLIMFRLGLNGQDYEMISGGGMEEADDDSWTVNVIGRMETEPVGDQIPEYKFGSTETSLKSQGKTLHVWAAGTGYVNIVFSQEVTLKANTKYVADGVFKDKTGELNNFWAQLKISLDGEPPQHENDGIKIKGFNTWSGCGQFVDGTFSEDACDSQTDGYGFVTPDTLGDEFTAYFAIVIGMWTNAETGAIPYDIVIDEVSLIDSLEAANSSSGNLSLAQNQHASLMNYPNPFYGETTIKYALENTSDVEIFVYNMLGEKILYLNEGLKQAGKHETMLDLTNCSNSILFCKLKYNDHTITKKMTLIR